MVDVEKVDGVPGLVDAAPLVILLLWSDCHLPWERVSVRVGGHQDDVALPVAGDVHPLMGRDISNRSWIDPP